MAERQIPGGAFINEDEAFQRQIPGSSFINRSSERLYEDSITFSTPWTRQPQRAIDVDWSNPLTRGLVYAGAYPATARRKGSASLLTRGTNLVSAAGSLNFQNSGTETVFGVIPELAGSSRFTIIALCRPTTIGTRNAFLFVGDSGTPANQFGIGSGYSNSGSMMLMQGNGNNWCVSANTDFFVAGITVFAGIVFSDEFGTGLNRVKAVKNGVTSAFSENGPFQYSPTTSTSVVMPGGSPSNTNIAGWNGDVYGIWIWDRALSDTELLFFSWNPWQLFEPRRIIIPNNKILTAPVLKSAHATNINATGFKPSVVVE